MRYITLLLVVTDMKIFMLTIWIELSLQGTFNPLVHVHAGRTKGGPTDRWQWRNCNMSTKRLQSTHDKKLYSQRTGKILSNW